MKIRNILIIMIILSAIAGSARYSRDVYRFYINSWYSIVKGQSRAELIKEARDLLDDKKYEELVNLSRKLLVAYPEDPELNRIAAAAFIHTGKISEGIKMLVDSESIKDLTPKEIKEIVRILYSKKQYYEITDMLDGRNIKDKPELNFMYGVSLYKTGKYRKAAKALRIAVKQGYDDIDAIYYSGLSLSKAGDTAGSIPYLERAWKRYSRDPELNRTLYRAYRDLGRYDDAERILRNGK